MAFPPSQPIDFVEEDYIGFYNRAGDAPGANFWVNQLNTSNTTLGVAVGFAVSSESTAIYPYLAAPNVLDPGTYITQIYTNVLGRAPDAPGLAFWLNELARLNTLYTGPNNTVVNLPAGTKLPNGSVDPKVVAAAEVLTEMLQSVNMQSGTADALLMGNRITVAEDYTIRTGNNNVNYSQASSHAVILATNGTPASVTTAEAITTAYIAGGGTGATFTLTTAVDAPGTGAFATSNLTGNNNQIFGTVGGVAPTYTPGDQIIGTAGSIGNVLSIADGAAGGITNISAVAATVSNVSIVSVTSGEGVAINTTAGFTGLTTLNVTSAATAGNADQITAAATTNVTVNDTATRATNAGTLTVNGGLAVTVTETNNDTGGGATLAPISIGATTAAAGQITVTNTDTLTGGSTSASITAKGAAGVTVNNTINEGSGAGVGTVAVTGGAAPIAVTETVNFTAGSFGTGTPGQITTNGGTTVTVTEAVSQAQTITGAGNQDFISEGSVVVNGGAATTTVTVAQANVAAGSGAVAASAGTAFVGAVAAVAAAPGVTGVTAVPGVAFVAPVSAVVGTATVSSDGAVTITDATNTSTATSTITTVSLSGFGAGSSITGAALTSLSLAGTGGQLNINNGAAGAATNTTLALALNGLSNSAAATNVVDNNNEITTLNITTGAASSKLDGFVDSGLKAVTIAGSSTVTLGGNFNFAADAALKTIAVSGAAGLTSANLFGFGANLALTTTSSGTITATLDDTTQTFVGSTGTDIISLAGDATKAITGGTATNNEVILTSAAATYTAAKFGTNVTGFTTLGVNDGGAGGTYDMHNIFKGYTAIDLQSNDNASFTGVTAGTTLAIDGTAGAVSYSLFTPSGTSTVSTTLGLATANNSVTVTNLTLTDSNADGVATVNLAANAKSATSGVVDQIVTLADPSLTTLNLSGNGAFTIGNVVLGNPNQNPAVGVPALTINNTSAAFASATSSQVGSTITNLTDDTLGSLTFGGTNGMTIVNLADNNAVNLTITSTDAAAVNITNLTTDNNTAPLVINNGLSNLTFSGSGVVNIGTETFTGGANTAALVIANTGTATDSIGAFSGIGTSTSLTVTGNVALGPNTGGLAGDQGTTLSFTSTAGVTVAAGTDNAHIAINLSGAAGGATDNITLGNANDYVLDASVQGHVNVTVGTGQNYIDLGNNQANNATAASYLANVTLGAHTAPDQIVTIGAFAGNANPNTIITGLAAGDFVTVHDNNAGLAVTTLSAAVLANAAAAGTIAQAVGIADAALLAHQAATFTFSNNTYLVESLANGTGTIQTGDTVVELVGTHTLSSTITAGHLTLLT